MRMVIHGTSGVACANWVFDDLDRMLERGIAMSMLSKRCMTAKDVIQFDLTCRFKSRKKKEREVGRARKKKE